MSNASLPPVAAKKLVSEFLHSWGERDIDKIMSYFAPDAVYHNVPVAPIKGEKAIREIFRAFLGAFDSIALDIVTIAGENDLVLAERVDRFKLKRPGLYAQMVTRLMTVAPTGPAPPSTGDCARLEALKREGKVQTVPAACGT